jgi:hypothetical protein
MEDLELQFPEDPDLDYCPDELRRHDGQPVRIEGIDRATGERVEMEGALVIVPGLFGAAARAREDDPPAA